MSSARPHLIKITATRIPPKHLLLLHYSTQKMVFTRSWFQPLLCHDVQSSVQGSSFYLVVSHKQISSSPSLLNTYQMGIKWVNCSFRYTEIRFFFFFYHTAAHLKSNYIRCYTRGFSSCVPLHFSLCVCICVQFCACVCIHHIFLLWFDQFRQKMVGTMNISVPAENHGATGCHRLSATVVCVCVCVCVCERAPCFGE